MTLLSDSEGTAYRELDRMLVIWAAHARRGIPVTIEESLEISGDPRGEYKQLLAAVLGALAVSQPAVQSTGS
ncbi:hypothetical protein CLIM01_01626 [Colletotrichum limetticola]|uniref:Uncharacterized protein n=1 Tax=Colletotrichum limetticola TaxID=1209924 RepID=A0ABQ9QB64_9PEZI|nr:hypothetical protein CLIM01_01626 [Colletotrichum limetticola]